jgi:hypothetical protein
MTLQEIDALQTKMLKHPANCFNSSALGRYQIVRTTLRTVRKSLSLPANALFDSEMQDRCACYLLGLRGIDKYLAGRLSEDTLIDNLAREWASLPTVSGNGVIGRGNAARNGVPVFAQPHQRRGLARKGPCAGLWRPAPARGEMRNGRADAAGEHALRIAGLERRVNVRSNRRAHYRKGRATYGPSVARPDECDRKTGLKLNGGGRSCLQRHRLKKRLIPPHLGLRKRQRLSSRSQAQQNSQQAIQPEATN